jgi:hypothetical protein
LSPLAERNNAPVSSLYILYMACGNASPTSGAVLRFHGTRIRRL